MFKIKKHIFFLLLLNFSYAITYSQCAMCRAVLETEDGQNAAKGINDGIVYLMIIPYLLVGGVGYLIYHKYIRPKNK